MCIRDRAGGASSRLSSAGAGPVGLVLCLSEALSSPVLARRPFGLLSLGRLLRLVPRRSVPGSVRRTGTRGLSVGSFLRAGLCRMLARPRLLGGGGLARTRSARAGGTRRRSGGVGRTPPLSRGALSGGGPCWRTSASLSVGLAPPEWPSFGLSAAGWHSDGGGLHLAWLYGRAARGCRVSSWSDGVPWTVRPRDPASDVGALRAKRSISGIRPGDLQLPRSPL